MTVSPTASNTPLRLSSENVDSIHSLAVVTCGRRAAA